MMSSPLTCCGEFRKASAQAPETFGHDNSRRTCVLDKIACISLVALFVLGCIGAAGQIPGPTLGWTAVGLGGVYFCSNFLMGGDLGKRKWILCTLALGSAAAITLGALGGIGVLSTQQAGTGLAILVPSVFLVASSQGIPARVRERIREVEEKEKKADRLEQEKVQEEEELARLRAQLKNQNPTLYQQLVDSGAIQPVDS